MVQTVWPFILIIVVLLGAAVFSLELMSSVRSCVDGESLWFKGQKQAFMSLVNYLINIIEDNHRDYLEVIAVPLGDNNARLTLNKENPDLAVAYKEFIEGKKLS